jgi:hypothetical protein
MVTDITEGTSLLCSNDLVLNKFGMHQWVIVNDLEELLHEGAGPVDGHPEMM